MVYFLETLAGDSVHEPVIVVKVGFSENFKKRLKDYKSTNYIFRVMKVLSDKSFDRKCEKILHYYLDSIGKRYKNQVEVFILDEEVEKLIESINTREDILKLQGKLSGNRQNFNVYLRKSSGRKRDFNKHLKRYKGILLKNWRLIEKSYSGGLEGLINHFIDSGLDDIFKFIKDYYNVDLLDYTDDEKGLLNEFFDKYNKIDTRQRKLKFLCEKLPNFNELERTCILESITETRFQEYIEVLGLEECKALAYNTSLLNKKIDILSFDKDSLKEDIYNEFKVGQAYPNAYSKQKLGEIYNKNNFRATPKSCDLGEYFDIKSKKAKDEAGNWVNGFYIISKKTGNVEFDKEELKADIFREFIVGNSYSTPYIKQKLGEIYSQRNYGTTAKSVDLDEFFNTKRKSVKDETGKWINGICIVSKK